MAADVLYINGRFTTTDERVLGVEDRGFQFGDAVYEVLKFLRKRPLFARNHYDRMIAGLRELEIRMPFRGFDDFETICGELLDRTRFQDGIIYVQVSRGESERAEMQKYFEDSATFLINRQE